MSSSPASPSRDAGAECALCGLALPAKPAAGPAGATYCCHGCAHVASILEAVGENSPQGRRTMEAARKRGLISNPSVETPAPQLAPEVREEKRLRISGLACPSCGWLAESILREVRGVAAAEVDYIADTVRPAIRVED